MPKKRRLAAIIFTDIVGYSAMMHKDEKSSLEILNRHRNILEQSTAAHYGKVIHYYGDGSLSIYNSSIEAVTCAIEMQEAFRSDPKVPLRIGIHLGDIVIGDGDVYGDGVNVASRIETLGVPGCIMVSKRIQEDLISHPEFHHISMGKFEFKNITHPIEVFAISNEGLAIPDKNKITGKLKEKDVINSLAVLPFTDFSQEKDQAWLTEGMTNALTHELRKISSLIVPSSTTMRTYKETDKTLPEIANELNVDAVIEGSALKIDDSVHITATLINAYDQSLWSDDYVVGMKYFYVLNHNIAQKITKEINIALMPADSARFTTPSLVHPGALEADLKGLKIFIEAYTIDQVKEAVEYYKLAIKLDSSFALPYAHLSQAYFWYHYFCESSPLESLALSESANNKALQLDPKLTLAYLNRFYEQYYIKWNWEEALKVLEKAQSLSVDDLEVLNGFLFYYISTGKFDKAFEILEKIRQINPNSIAYWSNKVMVQFHSRDLEGVLQSAEKGLKIYPHEVILELQMWSLSFLGRHNEAVDVARNILNNEAGVIPHRRGEIGCIFARAGLKDEALKQLDAIQELNVKYKYIDPVPTGLLYMGLGDKDMAMHYIEEGYKMHSIWIPFSKKAPPFDPMRGDRRFEKLVQKLKFP